MNQNQTPIQVSTCIEEMRALFLEARLLRQANRPILASILDDEAVAARNKGIRAVELAQLMGDMPETIPDYVRISLNMPRLAEVDA